MGKFILLALLAIAALCETSCASGCQRRKAAYFKRYVVNDKHVERPPYLMLKK